GAGRQWAERAVHIGRRYGDPGLLADAVNNLAMALITTGEEPHRALALAEEGVALLRRASATSCRVGVLDTLALAHRNVGGVEPAVAVEREALRNDSNESPLELLPTMTSLLVIRGQPERAARLAGAIDSACERLGLEPEAVWSDRRSILDQGLRALGA